MRRILITIITLAILGAGLWYASSKISLFETNTYIKSEPTDFVKAGTVIFNNPGLEPNTPYFVYEQPGSPAITKKLELDVMSFCVSGLGGLPCLAMSLSFDVAYKGKRVFIEGNLFDDHILVRKISTIEPGEPIPTESGHDQFVSWPNAITLIQECEATSIIQTHKLDVYMTLKDNTHVRTVEPGIDQINPIVAEAQKSCTTISFATE